jgi:diguanylate cyclase (GGDEF)-like protein
MSTQNDNARSGAGLGIFLRSPLVFVLISIAAIVATYAVTNSSLDLTSRTAGFAVILAAFILLSLVHLWNAPGEVNRPAAAEHEIERCLRSLDEANEYFAGSMTTSDIFRLVSSRAAEVTPFAACVLYLLNNDRTGLRLAASVGDAPAGSDVERPISATALSCYENRSIQTADHERGHEIALPLRHNGDLFGVLMVTFKPECSVTGQTLTVVEAIAERLAPLVLKALAFERSQATALTDVTTDLPNERAFYLILENQIAESQRKIDDRPLTILAMDIKNFADINERFGHAAGDAALNAAARIIKDNLRQMDFFARAVNDEFLAILPTASKAVSHEVVARVCTGFFGRRLSVTENDSIEVELNFGWAAFGEDGDTADQLLRAARIRKAQNKSTAENKVLWFQQEAEAPDLASLPS